MNEAPQRKEDQEREPPRADEVTREISVKGGEKWKREMRRAQGHDPWALKITHRNQLQVIFHSARIQSTGTAHRQ